MSNQRRQVFVSSVQKELAAERRALREFIESDALLRRFFTVFLFEDLPASDRRVDEVYLDEVDRSPVYVALLGRDYGFEDAQGVSPRARVRPRDRAKYRASDLREEPSRRRRAPPRCAR